MQFAIILDFVIIAPLGAIMMPSLGISAGQFGVAVSAFAFGTGVSAAKHPSTNGAYRGSQTLTGINRLAE
jgi:predicted MFS family arabinose efflux permease